jgi:hypothetical protein
MHPRDIRKALQQKSEIETPFISLVLTQKQETTHTQAFVLHPCINNNNTN